MSGGWHSLSGARTLPCLILTYLFLYYLMWIHIFYIKHTGVICFTRQHGLISLSFLSPYLNQSPAVSRFKAVSDRWSRATVKKCWGEMLAGVGGLGQGTKCFAYSQLFVWRLVTSDQHTLHTPVDTSDGREIN